MKKKTQIGPMDKGYTSVLLTNPSYPTTNALLRTIIQEFQLPKTAKSYKDNLDIFKAYLYQIAIEQGKTVVLIIDEAQTLRLPLLELLRQMINFETNEMKLLQLVLFAQEELRGKLQHPMARNFRSRIAMASTLGGNFTMLGSIANLIVVQRAATSGVKISFWDYFRVGAPLTIISLTVGTLWLRL